MKCLDKGVGDAQYVAVLHGTADEADLCACHRVDEGRDGSPSACASHRRCDTRHELGTGQRETATHHENMST